MPPVKISLDFPFAHVSFGGSVNFWALWITYLHKKTGFLQKIHFSGPQILVDGKLLAMQLIADGHATHGLRPLENSDIQALDSYIQRCKQLGFLRFRLGFGFGELYMGDFEGIFWWTESPKARWLN